MEKFEKKLSKSAAQRSAQIARAKEKREAVLKQIRKEKRVMLSSSFFAAIAALIWIFAISTDYWYNNITLNNGTTSVGLWRTCKKLQEEEEEECKYHVLFPNKEEIKRNPSLDHHVIDYQRTTIIFALFSLLLMLMSLMSAFYTFKNSRYMYKRLAAGLYFITAFCVLIVLEVSVTLITYEKLNVPFNQPTDSITNYGASFYSGWIVFFIYLINSAIFLIYSRKRKHQDDEQEHFNS